MNNFLGNFIIAFKEVLEAGIVVAIVMMFVIKLKDKSFKNFIYPLVGTLTGIVLAIGFGALSYYANLSFDDNKAYKISVYTIIIISVAYFLYWMFKQNYNLKHDINNQLTKSKYGFFIASFLITLIATFREGLEIVLITFEETNYWGIITGVGVAIIFMVLFFLIPNKFISFNKLMLWLSIILIFSTAPIALKWFEIVVWKGIDLYKIESSNGWTDFGLAILRGVFGFKSSLRLSGLISIILWDVIWISIFLILRNSKISK